jgi:hypothetical protein
MSLSDILHTPPLRAYQSFKNYLDTDNSDGCDIIRAMLLDAGWKQTGTTQATAAIGFPLGFPSAPPGSTSPWVLPTERLAAFVAPFNAPGVKYVWYGPGEPNPTGFDGVNFTAGVFIGGSPNASAGNLALKMDAGLWITTIVSDLAGNATGINFIARLPGTGGNNYFFDGNGGNSLGSGFSVGGGWIMESQCQQDNEPASTNTTKTRITAKTWGPNRLNLIAEVDGVDPFGWILKRGEWQGVATNYTVFLFEKTPFGAGDVYIFDTWLYAGSLYIPPELTVVKVGMILRFGGTQNTVGLGTVFADVNTGVDGKKMLNGGWGAGQFSFCFWHYEADTLEHLTQRMGKSIMAPVLVMMPTTQPTNHLGVSDEARVVGYLWDAFLVTEYHAPGTLIVEENQPYRATFAQLGAPVATVFLSWPVKPPEQAAPLPVPSTFVGTCNVFGAGVTRLTGDPFTSDMVGKIFWITTDPTHTWAFTVIAVIDADHLTLSDAGAGILTGANFTTDPKGF